MNEFIKLISNKKIWVYGAGYVALHFWEALKKRGFSQQVQGFVESQVNESMKCIAGFFVKPINQLIVDKDTVVCIAVHEVYKDEIAAILCQRGINNYIWITPFLYDLHFGKPIMDGVWIDTRRFIPICGNEYGMAVRWAAIEDYYGICPNGFFLYEKAMALHSNMSTAQARAGRFRTLIQKWSVIGYQDDMQISINRVFEILDGEHRMVLALYHGQNKLKCKIYDGENIHGEKTRMTKKMLLEGGFTRKELYQLDRINALIRKTVL